MLAFYIANAAGILVPYDEISDAINWIHIRARLPDRAERYFEIFLIQNICEIDEYWISIQARFCWYVLISIFEWDNRNIEGRQESTIA